MSGSAMMMHLVLERLSRRISARVPEAELVMSDPAQNAAFGEAGREDGILAFMVLYHAVQMTSVISPGDTVLDLACGPANQLAQVARLNPQSRFVGLDASSAMLHQARATLQRCRIDNTDLVQGDMTDLAGFHDRSVDCVVCTMSLHHLADVAALHRAMREARRVLKAEGGAYIVDFGRLKRLATQRHFALNWRHKQSATFTQEYFQSLRAAFSVDELTSAAAALGGGIERCVTPLAPFMIVFRSRPRRTWSADDQHTARRLYADLDADQRTKFRVLARWLRAARCNLPLALEQTGV
ncbi:MAG TPA: class I SAM-dependent methyltransferase [Burkholderiaceae bacterium]|jgi:ubiquinone/menaquinone biosynthesis C-methylase UbiE|nr:class I SAM-dependent methyltransferase [Burkholderiaceae bacterium]